MFRSYKVKSQVASSNTFTGIFLQGLKNSIKIDQIKERIENFVKRVDNIEEFLSDLPELEGLRDAVKDCKEVFTEEFLTELTPIVDGYHNQIQNILNKIANVAKFLGVNSVDDLVKEEQTSYPEQIIETEAQILDIAEQIKQLDEKFTEYNDLREESIELLNNNLGNKNDPVNDGAVFPRLEQIEITLRDLPDLSELVGKVNTLENDHVSKTELTDVDTKVKNLKTKTEDIINRLTYLEFQDGNKTNNIDYLLTETSKLTNNVNSLLSETSKLTTLIKSLSDKLDSVSGELEDVRGRTKDYYNGVILIPGDDGNSYKGYSLNGIIRNNYESAIIPIPPEAYDTKTINGKDEETGEPTRQDFFLKWYLADNPPKLREYIVNGATGSYE